MNHIEAGKLGAIASKETQQKQLQQRIDTYNENPTKCLNCHAVFTYKNRHNKFCNSSCAATYNNKMFPKRFSKHNSKACLFCGKPLSRHNSLYCNNQCQQDYKWEQNKKKIVEQGKFASEHSNSIKRFLLETYGHQCSICKQKEWMDQPIPLIVDHIDGHSENNEITNLRFVCGNCDMQLPTYKSKNKGNGRQWRKQRYTDGKSY